MKYINHLTLSTGHTSRIQCGDVSGEAIARVGPWLDALLVSGQPAPVPVSALAEFDGLASQLSGSLIVTISGKPPRAGPMAGKPPPLITLGVARKSRHGAQLWPLMTGPVMPAVKPGLMCPQTPWCAVAIWPTIALHPEATEWLGDLERCIAWTWVERNP